MVATVTSIVMTWIPELRVEDSCSDIPRFFELALKPFGYLHV